MASKMFKKLKNKDRPDEDPAIPRVYNELYFYGRITRQEAEEILTINGLEDGMYLLRESITPMGNFSLSMSFDERVVHYSIEKKVDGQYMIADGISFPDPVALIQHYQAQKKGFLTVPEIPCTRRPDQEAVAFRGLSYKELHNHMKVSAREMGANMSQAFGPKRESLLMHVLQTMHTKMPWYHGAITREECIKRLEESGHEDGKFIVRQRADGQTFALTMSSEGQCRHYFILVNDGETYSIENGQRFKALIILVDHYHNKRDGLPCKLAVPCPNADVKHQAFENYMKLHKNLTSKPGSRSGSQKSQNGSIGGSTPPGRASNGSIGGSTPPGRMPNGTTNTPSPQLPPARVPGRPPPPIPVSSPGMGAIGGRPGADNIHPRKTSYDPWDPPNFDDSDDDNEVSASPMGRAMSMQEAEELENVYIDIREDVLSNDLKPEQVILGDKLGSGQFGEVKKGICKFIRKEIPVAVKTLKKDDPVGEREILEEANLMKRLNHQHIVRMIGVCKGESLMLVLELAELGALKKFLERNIDMTTWHKVEMMYQICDGMSYLESKDVVHRDLATRNVLLVNEHFAKISDFGMSRMLDDSSTYYTAHGPGRWPLMWYAPECLYYHKFDSKSDVWSFGVAMWEIMSFGARPYDRKKPNEILAFIESGSRLRKPRHCDDRIYNVMLSCWEFRKEGRPTFSALKPKLHSLYKEFKQRGL